MSYLSIQNDLQTKRPGKRILELDALRCFAALNLMAFHFTHVYDVKFGYVQSLGFEWPYGAYGVELFFILSGYVNSMSLLKRQDTTNFLAARMIRIVPIFLIALLFNFAVVRLAPHDGVAISGSQWLANVTLMPGIFGHECIDPVMWTLQVELLFYIAIVVMYRGGLLNHFAKGWGVMIALSLVLCPLLDSVAPAQSGTMWFMFASSIRRILFLDYAPLFAIGYLLYQIRAGRGSRIQSVGWMILSAAVFHMIDHGKHNPLATLLIVGCVFAAGLGRIPPLRWKPLAYISAISYPIYLFHNNLGCAVIHHFNHAGVPSIVCLAIAVVLSVAVAALATHRIEKPITAYLGTVVKRWVKPRVEGKPIEITVA